MINIQPVEKSIASNGDILDVHSIFYTIQGEGPFAGSPAVFIRLAGCNLRCPGCDTDYTEGRRQITAVRTAHDAAILGRSMHHKLVVITGGEPFRQNIKPLVSILEGLGFHVQIETNGTLPPPAGFSQTATVVCSPKAGKVNKGLIPFIKAYKYVLSARSQDINDGLPTLALDHTAMPCVARPHEGFDGPVYLQPADDQDSDLNAYNREATVRACLKFGYILQLQIHKLIGVE